MTEFDIKQYYNTDNLNRIVKGIKMKKKSNVLKKREFLSVIKKTYIDCLSIFGYKKGPYLLESKLPLNVDMEFRASKLRNDCAIFYDYQKIMRYCHKYDRKNAICEVVFSIAHEMRHYYQFRQIRAKYPQESKKLIEKWKVGYPLNPTEEEYYKNVAEIDAYTFAYIYLSVRYKVLKCKIGAIPNYYKLLKKCSKENFGEVYPVFKRKYKKYFD